MTEETLSFQAEVAKLLDIVVHSLYSDREIFLRELISNASDSCDRLRYAAQTQGDLTAGDGEFRIRLIPDKEAGTLTIIDNGYGMSRQELIDNLGTIAKSGTDEFLKALGESARKNSNQIGQFGVGFYSAFMVADKVEVKTHKAGEQGGWLWTSAGHGSFTITEAADASRGASITLHLKEDAKEYLDVHSLKGIVKRFSDHIALPVLLKDGDSEEAVNSASALWTRPKGEITAEQYTEFYHHSAHQFDEPWAVLHYRAEGAIEYTGLLFIPSSKPFDLFNPDRKNNLKLYVKRVFITDHVDDLLPPWLRFLRGVVDTPDLPLNVSRELLQHNPLLAKIRTGLVKRVLSELKKKSTDTDCDYIKFWENFGSVLKEGLYEDRERQADILPLCRFRTTFGDDWYSLDEIVARMKPEQEALYTITGDNLAKIKRSPQLEGFVAKGIEVMLLADPIDDFWLSAVFDYQGKSFKSVTEAGEDLSKIISDDPAQNQSEKVPEGDLATLIAAIKIALGDAVQDVRVSNRLTESAVCLVAGEGQMSMHLEKLLRSHGQVQQEQKKVLEINPGHALIKALAASVAQQGAAAGIDDLALLLLDQARILEGELPTDPMAFAKRLGASITKGLSL
jgi:molecular chaperone HtpG